MDGTAYFKTWKHVRGLGSQLVLAVVTLSLDLFSAGVNEFGKKQKK